MSEKTPGRSTRWTVRHKLSLGILAAATGVAAAAALLLPLSAQPFAGPIEVGQVAGEDIIAPRAISFESEVVTEENRAAAAAAVEPVYAPPNTSVARAQVGRLRAALTFMETVRQDELATNEQKLADLAALQDIDFDQQTSQAILDLSAAAWQSVQQESISVLEQLMRSTIREDRLEEARRSIPALVSLSIPEEQAMLVAEIVSAFVAPNSLFSEPLTEAARQAARDAVEPVVRSFAPNQAIVRRGQLITAANIETLQQFGLVQPQARWQDQVAVVALVLASLALFVLFFRYRADLLKDLRRLTLVAIFFVIFLFGARFLIPGRTVIPYIYPLAGFALLATALFSAQAAMVIALPLSVMAAYNLPNALDLTLYYAVGSLFGILVLKRGQRIASYFWAAAAIAAAGAAMILAYRLPDPNIDLVGILSLLGGSALNGLGAASITLILQLFVARILGLTTTLELLEISRPDRELLQLILRNAPGTYQHSLLIANLAEQAAEQIQADAMLTRVGALYHDAGKALNPHFFIENQVEGSSNPHDELDAYESSAIIIRHVTDGLDLAKKYRVTRRIQDFIAEHHGTLLTRYQYARAVEAADGDTALVETERFRYPGPRPQSRETALVMLADGSEALTRAERPETKEELRSLVKGLVDRRITQGQLDDTELTMQDLNTVVDSFTSTLRGVYHPRITYPALDEETQPGALLETEGEPSGS
jgi:hypothetical protein